MGEAGFKTLSEKGNYQNQLGSSFQGGTSRPPDHIQSSAFWAELCSSLPACKYSRMLHLAQNYVRGSEGSLLSICLRRQLLVHSGAGLRWRGAASRDPGLHGKATHTLEFRSLFRSQTVSYMTIFSPLKKRWISCFGKVISIHELSCSFVF